MFEIKNGVKYPAADRIKGNLPLISTSSQNNGISDWIYTRQDSIYSNIITVAYSGAVGSTFYQEQSVFVGETVMALVPKFSLNSLNGSYLCTCMKQINRKYSYTKKMKVREYGNEQLLLPVNNQDLPDWSYIETYASAIQKKIIQNYNKDALLKIKTTKQVVGGIDAD